MDPLSSIGLAASVIQFVQFIGSLVSKSREIYNNGNFLDHMECQNASMRLLDLTSRVKESINEINALGQLSPDALALKTICEESIKFSEEIVSHLHDLKVDPTSKLKRWKSFRQALKSVCSKNKVDGLARRLQITREELNVHLVGSIMGKADFLALYQEQALTSLKEDAKNIIEAVIQNRHLLKIELGHQNGILINSSAKDHANTAASVLRALDEAQKVEARLLRSLEFSEINNRHMQIEEAHQETFKWILNKNGEEGVGYSDFVEWLEKGRGVYWINGKAGSGKSTLMRFAFDHEMTKNYLSTWAEEKNLGLFGFFFWMHGTAEQRSYSGLLRALLHQALEKRPNLALEIFPDEWAKFKADHGVYQANFSWELPALKMAFKRWIDLTSVSSKLCFFIDGLDEYDGDHEEMADYFQRLSSAHGHVKFCVSSRPWVVFDDAFEGVPSLRLQDLTFADIKSYVFDKLENHRRMQKLVEADQGAALQLVTELVTKASGVFLWVTLVVKSLLDGLRNRDTILDLQRRLRSLPDDLTSLYSRMLKHVEPLYRQKAAETFQIFMTMENDSAIPAIWLQIAITGDTEHLKHRVSFYFSAKELREKTEWLDIHLKTRCAGLLEIVNDKRLPISGMPTPGEYSLTSKVTYLHRTVADFLVADDVRTSMLEATDSSFDPNIRTIIARVFAMKKCRVFDDAWRGSDFDEEKMWPFIETTMTFASRVEKAGRAYTVLMDEMENVAIQCCDKYQEETAHDKRKSFDRQRYFRTAMRYELRTYVEGKLKISCLGASDFGLQTLVNALTISNQWEGIIPASMYELILTAPWLDLNHIRLHNSLWQHFLTEVHTFNVEEPMDKEYLKTLTSIFKIMLERGANPQTTCIKNHPLTKFSQDFSVGCHTVKHVIIDLFELLLPEEYEELIHLLQKRIEFQAIKQKQKSSNIAKRKMTAETVKQGFQKRQKKH